RPLRSISFQNPVDLLVQARQRHFLTEVRRRDAFFSLERAPPFLQKVCRDERMQSWTEGGGMKQPEELRSFRMLYCNVCLARVWLAVGSRRLSVTSAIFRSGERMEGVSKER
ncbi:unnamed protein product, partial [Phaeothamnion confervicola]